MSIFQSGLNTVESGSEFLYSLNSTEHAPNSLLFESCQHSLQWFSDTSCCRYYMLSFMKNKTVKSGEFNSSGFGSPQWIRLSWQFLSESHYSRAHCCQASRHTSTRARTHACTYTHKQT
jgi:hypothetical protein